MTELRKRERSIDHSSPISLSSRNKEGQGKLVPSTYKYHTHLAAGGELAKNIDSDIVPKDKLLNEEQVLVQQMPASNSPQFRVSSYFKKQDDLAESYQSQKN